MSATLSDLLGADAAPSTFEHAGEKFTVSPIIQQAKTAIEKALRARSYRDLYDLRDVMPADQYQHSLEALQRDRASYVYLGPVFWSSLGTHEFNVLMVRVVFGASEDQAERLLAEREADVQAVVQEQIISSMPRAQAESMRVKLAEKRKREGLPLNPPVPA